MTDLKCVSSVSVQHKIVGNTYSDYTRMVSHTQRAVFQRPGYLSSNESLHATLDNIETVVRFLREPNPKLMHVECLVNVAFRVK